MPFEPLGRPTLIGREQLSCGEVMLTQIFTNAASPDAYVVSLYLRPSGADEWSEYYLDHESLYWRGSIEVAGDRARCAFRSYGSLRGSFSCEERKMVRPNGVRLGPKASLNDPLSPEVGRQRPNSPMDVGAASNDPFPGYRSAPSLIDPERVRRAQRRQLGRSASKSRNKRRCSCMKAA
jgi:hypothetical protein